MERREIHVVYDSEMKFWKVTWLSNTLHRCTTQQEAIDYARDLSKKYCAELIIHKKNGQIQNSDSHGHDPCPPRDKK